MRCAWLLLILFLAGCAAPAPRVLYVDVPAALLELCAVPDPAALDTTFDLEDAFIVAYQCAEQGNRDKDRIRSLPRNSK